jgi:hypothetical protein
MVALRVFLLLVLALGASKEEGTDQVSALKYSILPRNPNVRSVTLQFSFWWADELNGCSCQDDADNQHGNEQKESPVRISARSTAQQVFLVDMGLQQNEVAFLHRVSCVFQIACAHGHTSTSAVTNHVLGARRKLHSNG